LDRQRAVHEGMLVEPGPGELEQRPAQGRMLRPHKCVGLHEDESPRGAERVACARTHQRRDVDRPTDGRRGNLTREVDQIDDESPGPAEWENPSLRLVHPCTSPSLNGLTPIDCPTRMGNRVAESAAE